MELIYDFLSTNGFQPHGYCFFWHPGIFWSHLLADLVTGLSYLSIPAALIYLGNRRSDIVPIPILGLFSAFVVFCGMTHLFGIWTIWVPAYGYEAIIKTLTAIISALAALTLWVSMPTTLALPTVAQLNERTSDLEKEVRRREKLEAEMVQYRQHLELEVESRTEEVDSANARLRDFAQASADVFWETASDLSFSWVSEEPDSSSLGAKLLFKDALTDLPRAAGTQSPEEFVAFRNKVAERKAFRDLEFEVLDPKTGERFWWRASGRSYFDEEMNFKGYRGTATDISLQRETAAQLRRIQNSELVGRLAGGVAHDFNNILTVLSGNLGLLDSSQITEPQKTQILARCRTAAKRASHLTGQLLALGRRQPLQPSAIDLSKLLQETGELVRRTLPPTFELNVDCEPGIPKLFADTGAFQDALLNLIVNARDAMPEGGQIEIAARKIDAPTTEDTGTGPHDQNPQLVRVSVSDTGQGIPEAIREKIFEPFFTRKAQGEGSGLGLSMVLGFVTQSGGEISVETRESEGSSFHLDFPISKFPVTIDAVEAGWVKAFETEEELTEKSWILLVDDDLDVLSTVQLMLEAMRYRVSSVTNGADALQFLGEASELPNAVLSDIMMPGPIQGTDLASVLEKSHPNIPVVLMTGFSPHSDDKQGGVSSKIILKKPIDPALLHTKLRGVIKKNQR